MSKAMFIRTPLKMAYFAVKYLNLQIPIQLCIHTMNEPGPL